MNLQIPPVFYFLVATALLVFGPVRAYYFGWKHRDAPGDETRRGASARKRHIIWGSLWFVFGVYIAYLGLQLQRQQQQGEAQLFDDAPTRQVRFTTMPPAADKPAAAPAGAGAAPAADAPAAPATIKADPTPPAAPAAP